MLNDLCMRPLPTYSMALEFESTSAAHLLHLEYCKYLQIRSIER